MLPHIWWSEKIWSHQFLFWFVCLVFFFPCHCIYPMSQWAWQGPKEDELVKYIDGWLGLAELPGGTDICDMRTTGNLFLQVQEGNSKHSWGANIPDGSSVAGAGGTRVRLYIYTVFNFDVKSGWTENPSRAKCVFIQLKAANLIVRAGKIKWQHPSDNMLKPISSQRKCSIRHQYLPSTQWQNPFECIHSIEH